MVPDCCSVDNSLVVDSRTVRSKGHEQIPPKIRVRVRVCKTCQTQFTTYEGELENLFNGYRPEFEVLSDKV